MTTNENKTGCAACNPEAHPSKSHDEIEAARIAAWEEDVIIAGDGNCHWAVISMDGGHRFHDRQPCVIHAGLESREAAEVARWDALLGLTDQTHRSPYGPSEMPLSYYNAVGRVVAKLREEGVQSDYLIALAVSIAEAASERCSVRIPANTHDSEIWF